MGIVVRADEGAASSTNKIPAHQVLSQSGRTDGRVWETLYHSAPKEMTFKVRPGKKEQSKRGGCRRVYQIESQYLEETEAEEGGRREGREETKALR